MATTITQRANSIAHKSKIKGEDASKLVGLAEKDMKLSRTEARALEKVAKLPDDRFVKYDNGALPSSVDELRGSAEWSKELLDCKLDVKSTIPGLSVTFDRHVSVEDNEYGNLYRRFLNVQLKGKTAGKDGTVSFEYGDFSVSVKVKKGQKAESIFAAIERRILAQQNGSMSVRGGYDSERVLNPSIGFGIHRTAPMTAVEKLEFQVRMLEADLMEANMEEAPDVITDAIREDIAALEKKIAKLKKEG